MGELIKRLINDKLEEASGLCSPPGGPRALLLSAAGPGCRQRVCKQDSVT